MSVQAMSWAFAADTRNSSTKLVLLCLANYAGRDCLAHPGQKSIARETKLSLRTVNASLKALEDDGFICRERRTRDDGSRTSDLYLLQIDKVQPLHVEDEPNVQNLQGQHATIAHQYKPNGLSEPVREPLDAREEQFAEFWAQYPRKVAKPAAERAYLKALKKYPHAQILAGVIRHAAAWARDGTEKQFIPHPATFLNQERFNDEPQPPRRNPKSERANEIEKYKRSIAAAFEPGGDHQGVSNLGSGDGQHGEALIGAGDIVAENFG